MTLEDQLRDTLADDRRALPAWPDATERVHSGMRRRRRVTVAATAVMALAVVALPVVIVGQFHRPVVISPGASPATPTATDAHGCTVADFASQATSSGSGNALTVIKLTDTASTPCQLTAGPVLVTVDADHATHAIPVDATERNNMLPPPVQPGQHLYLEVVASSMCAGAQPAVYVNVALTIGAGGRIPVPGLTLTSICVLQIGTWHAGS